MPLKSERYVVVSKTKNVTSVGQLCFLLIRYIISNNLLRQWLEGIKIDKAKCHLEGDTCACIGWTNMVSFYFCSFKKQHPSFQSGPVLNPEN